MSACIQRIDNKHRQVAEYPALCADGSAVRIAPWSYAWNRGQAGQLPNGGCLYGGLSSRYCTRPNRRYSSAIPAITRIPVGSAASSPSNNSASIQRMLTLTRLAMPPCTKASLSDL